MSTRTTPWPAGTPCWIDMSVVDLDAAKQFYGSVLGWSFLDTGEEFGHYTLCQIGGKSAAALSGLMPGMSRPVPWTVYVATDDAAASAKLVVENGGSLIVEPMAVPGNGTMAVAVDPCGGAFGLWQADGMVGFEIANEPGSVSWTDTRLTDAKAGMAFYTAVFGWSYQPVPGAGDEYGTAHVGDGDPVGGVGGMMGAPEGTPSHWLAYFAVADLDAAVHRLVAGGGSVVREAQDTPFGRIGDYADPTGVAFSLIQPPAG